MGKTQQIGKMRHEATNNINIVMPRPPKEGRGKFLTIMLVVGAVGLLTSLPDIAGDRYAKEIGITNPAWYPMYTLVSDAILGNALLGMWKLKKWGVYLGVLSVAIDNVFGNIPLIQSHKFNYDQILVDNLLANSLDPLWFIAIKRKWHLSS